MTEYRKIKGYPNYRVSDEGVVQSNWGDINKSLKGKGKEGWQNLKPGLSGGHGKEYLSVCLCDGVNKPKSIRVHRLVAASFLRELKKGECVRHLDGNRSNNALTNLAIGTYVENEEDKRRHGTWDRRMGGAKLSLAAVDEVRRLAKEGHSQKDLAARFGVSRPTITRVVNNTIWRRSCAY